MMPTHCQVEVRKVLQEYRREDMLRPSYNNVVQEKYSERIARRNIPCMRPITHPRVEGVNINVRLRYWFAYQFGRPFIIWLIG